MIWQSEKKNIHQKISKNDVKNKNHLELKKKLFIELWGGHMVPYQMGELGKGLVVDVFTGAGESAGRDFFSDHIGHDDVICVAGRKLDENE